MKEGFLCISWLKTAKPLLGDNRYYNNDYKSLQSQTLSDEDDKMVT